MIWLYAFAIVLLAVGLPVFSYLDHIYRRLGRVSTGRLHEHLEIFEAEIEPRLHLHRRQAALTFNLLPHLWLALIVLETARGVFYFVPDVPEAILELFVFLGLEVAVGMHFIPDFLLARTTGRWLLPLIPVLRASAVLVWPLRALLDLATTLARISEEEPDASANPRADSEGIEALVEAAEEEGIIEPGQADLFEQIVEFSDKRVREVMTPRPDIVAIQAGATVEALRKLVVETRFSRLPVYEGSLEDIIGIVFAHDLLQIAERDAASRRVRELVRPALFVPESKLGSELLKEMRQKNQNMAIVVDEYGSVAGLATIEDLVEEIVGEIGEQHRHPSPDIVREPDGGFILRGSLSVDRLRDLLGVEFSGPPDGAATTVAGLLNLLAGHVPLSGERIEHGGLQFEVLEANQRKVLRLRARRRAASAARSS
jgi:CBS domain containing-hemolysin-like protein